jgi:hypothetical protein
MITLRDVIRAWAAWFALQVRRVLSSPAVGVGVVIKDGVAVLTVQARNGTKLSCEIRHEGELIEAYRALMASKIEHDSRMNQQEFQTKLIQGGLNAMGGILRTKLSGRARERYDAAVRKKRT